MNDDLELLAGIARRDSEAFQLLMERYSGKVMNVAFRLLGTHADAEEVTQDVFFRLYVHPPQLTPETRLFTWLYRVAVNRSLDLLRRRPTRTEILSLEQALPGDSETELPLQEKLADPSGSIPRDQMAATELAVLTRRSIARLPKALRVPLILSTIEELSHAEIARILKTSVKAVEHRIARARQLLKEYLAPHL